MTNNIEIALTVFSEEKKKLESFTSIFSGVRGVLRKLPYIIVHETT